MSGGGGGEEEDYTESSRLLLSSSSSKSDQEKGTDLESSQPNLHLGKDDPIGRSSSSIKDILTRHFDPPFSPRTLSFKRHRDSANSERDEFGSSARSSQSSPRPSSPPLADGAPPEWALLLIGCLLGLATGLLVAAFNNGVGTLLLSHPSVAINGPL